jgi:hypothetical protein
MRGPRPNTTRLRAWAVGLACGLCLSAGCASKAPPQTGGSSSSKADKARKDAEALALKAVTEGASAQARAVPEAARRKDVPLTNFKIQDDNGPPAPNKSGASAKAPVPPVSAPPLSPAPPVVTAPVSPPTPAPRVRPGPPSVVRERLTSIPAPEAEAEEDVLNQARELIERKLAQLDPPVRYKPSISEVKAEFIRKDSRLQRPFIPTPEQQKLYEDNKLTANFVQVEYDVEVTAEQVRELRSQDRSWAALRVLGILVAIALAGFLFLRIDEWTKGYLTSWLALGAVVLAGGAAAAFLFV